ncbi:plasma-membrane choline transporter-domain-containing protein [Sporodiniella umbellata]|nr:plasma-membrane choline transporter-domain-containing protein [Sporodiniella umbellata]
MDQSIQFARDTISSLRNSVFYGKRSGYYAQMDAESENEDDDNTHSLFYSVHQSDHNIEDSIPLTLSNAYSDRSQLLFEQTESDQSEEEEDIKPSSIYLDQPESSKIIPPVNAKSLSESLLPTVSSSSSVESYVKESTFKAIKDSAGMLAIVIGTSLVVATLWLLLLRHFAKALVWGNKKSNFNDTTLTWLSTVPLIFGFVYTAIVYNNRHRISKTVAVIELACEVIRSNPTIFIIPVSLLTVFVVFTSIWITFFNRLWLIGRLSSSSSSSSIVWIVNHYVYYIAAFYVFFYMWTSMALVYLEKFALSGMTAQWYFHRNNPTNNTISVWKSVLLRGLTTSFGTVALAGLLMAIIQFLQFITRFLRKFSKQSVIVGYILGFIEPLVSTVNNYTIGLSGISGESFFSSAKSTTKIFRRNLLSGVFGDLLTQIILHIVAVVIMLVSGLSAYVYTTHQLHSPHGFVVGLIGALMPYYISQFYSYTMVSM